MTFSTKWTMIDRNGFVLRHDGTVADLGEIVGICGTSHNRDDLDISDDGKKITVLSSQVEMTHD